jgi:hypothetical protein
MVIKEVHGLLFNLFYCCYFEAILLGFDKIKFAIVPRNPVGLYHYNVVEGWQSGSDIVDVQPHDKPIKCKLKPKDIGAPEGKVLIEMFQSEPVLTDRNGEVVGLLRLISIFRDVVIDICRFLLYHSTSG